MMPLTRLQHLQCPAFKDETQPLFSRTVFAALLVHSNRLANLAAPRKEKRQGDMCTTTAAHTHIK